MYPPHPPSHRHVPIFFTLLVCSLIIGAGHGNLAETCPLCDYSPLNPQDCSENIPLRKTIQVFLRHAEQQKQTSNNQVPSIFVGLVDVRRYREMDNMVRD